MNENINSQAVPGRMDVADKSHWRTEYQDKDANMIGKMFVKKNNRIGNRAFYNCGLKELALPPNLALIGDEAFRGCTFQELALPSGLTSIGQNFFYGRVPSSAAL